jgi:tetratricopeptide (TPR) repeat protein
VPFNFDYRHILGYAYYNLRRFGDAIDQFEKAQELEPNFRGAEPWLGHTYAIQRRDDEAVTEYLAWLREALVPGRMPAATAALAKAYTRSGWDGFWRKELELAEEEYRQQGTVWQVPYGRRMINWRKARRYARLAEWNHAIASLEAGYEARERNMVYLNVEPLFDSLRPDPRFQDLVRRVGLKP